MIIWDNGSVKLWRIKDGKFVRTLSKEIKYLSSTLVRFSPNSNYLILSFEDDLKDKILLFRVSDGTLIKSFVKPKYYRRHITFSSNSKIFSVADNENINLWRVSNGKFLKTLKGNKSEYFISSSFSPDGRFLASGNDYGAIKLWRVSDGVLIRTFKGHDAMVHLISFSPDTRLMVSASKDRTIKLWEIEKGGLLCTLFNFGKGRSVALTPEGFFSGSGDFNKYVHFVKGLDVYDFNQFYDAFYRPDLVEKKLKGEDISKYTGGLNIDDAIKNPPPEISILSPDNESSFSESEVTLKVKIKDTGGGIGDIRVYHNGKLIESLGVYRLAKVTSDNTSIELVKADIGSSYQSAIRGTSLRRVWGKSDSKNIKTMDFKPLSGTIVRSYTITPIRGENTLSVSAFNGTNTVMSSIESIKIKSDTHERKPELFALVMGNNIFKDPRWNLFHAKKDAEDFSRLIKKAAAPLYARVHVRTLLDAGKTSIIEAVNSMGNDAKPGDTFIFYAATHGNSEDDLYYIYTTDFNGDLRNPDSFLSSAELMEISKRITALKQVFILDTCQAGGVEAIVTGLYDARISVLAKALGMHILAGTKTYQDASDEYGDNGLFTHFILSGLRGAADQDQDKKITASEMSPYLSQRVKEASKGGQEPFIRNFGVDFPISTIMN